MPTSRNAHVATPPSNRNESPSVPSPHHLCWLALQSFLELFPECSVSEGEELEAGG